MKPVSSRSLYENINPFPTNNFKCGMDFSWMPKTVCPKQGFSKVLYVVLVLIFSPLLEIPWFTQHWKWVTWNQNVWKACSLKCLQSLTIQVSPTECNLQVCSCRSPFPPAYVSIASSPEEFVWREFAVNLVKCQLWRQIEHVMKRHTYCSISKCFWKWRVPYLDHVNGRITKERWSLIIDPYMLRLFSTFLHTFDTTTKKWKHPFFWKSWIYIRSGHGHETPSQQSYGDTLCKEANYVFLFLLLSSSTLNEKGKLMHLKL